MSELQYDSFGKRIWIGGIILAMTIFAVAVIAVIADLSTPKVPTLATSVEFIDDELARRQEQQLERIERSW